MTCPQCQRTAAWLRVLGQKLDEAIADLEREPPGTAIGGYQDARKLARDKGELVWRAVWGPGWIFDGHSKMHSITGRSAALSADDTTALDWRSGDR